MASEREECKMNFTYSTYKHLIEFDEFILGIHGYYKCPVCGSSFCGGGKALHKEGCPEKGYENAIYVYGEECLDHLKNCLNSFGLEYFHGAWRELAILKTHNCFEDSKTEERLKKYSQGLKKVAKDTALIKKEVLALKRFLAD